MAPFPESESMTIKRLEVALRKRDMQLLKDGAYKLHEKFHTGHKFEFLSELEQILDYVKVANVPSEIMEILCPTIEEIINQETYKTNEKDALQLGDEDIKLQGPAYEEYMAQQQLQTEDIPLQEEIVEQNDKEDFKHFETPIVTLKQTEHKPYDQTDNIVFFYDDNSSDVNYGEIKNYRNKLNNLFSSQTQKDDCNILKEIALINNLVDTKIFDIDKILNMLKTSKNDVSFVTTCQSQYLTKLLQDLGINFKIPFVQKSEKNADKNQKVFDFIPMLGLSNIFVCSIVTRFFGRELSRLL